MIAVWWMDGEQNRSKPPLCGGMDPEVYPLRSDDEMVKGARTPQEHLASSPSGFPDPSRRCSLAPRRFSFAPPPWRHPAL